MKTFILIKDKDAATFKAENIEEAKEKAIGSYNHSHEVIIREIEVIYDYAELSAK